MTRPVLVVLSRRGRDSLTPPGWERLGSVADVRVVQRDAAPTPDEAVSLLADADVLGSTNLCLPRVDEALLARLPRLRWIVLYATGFDHLDVGMLSRRGVGLSVLPAYATTAVAEHALAMLLALSTRLHLAHDRSRGVAPPDASLRGVELAERTLGIIGVGRIGGRLARLACGLGMSVLGHDVCPVATARAVATGVRMTTLDDVLQRSDAVAVCASHPFGGDAIVGHAQVARMRAGSFLVNVGRPALVETAAVVDALRGGHLRGYGVDDVVLGAPNADLVHEGRVLQTGHSAWWRDEVLDRGAAMWADRLFGAATGAPLDVVADPGRAEPFDADDDSAASA